MVTNAYECLTNDLANVTNAYECPCNSCKRLTNETTTQRIRGELHINPLTMLLNSRVSQVTWTCSQNMATRDPSICKFSLNMVNSSYCYHTVANMVANWLTHVLRSLQMPCHHYKCLAITKIEWLTIAYENVAKTMRIWYSRGI
jgi:hypothetical protein